MRARPTTSPDAGPVSHPSSSPMWSKIEAASSMSVGITQISPRKETRNGEELGLGTELSGQPTSHRGLPRVQGVAADDRRTSLSSCRPRPLAGSSTPPMARSSRRRPSATASLQRPLDPGAACTIGTTECQSHDCPKFSLPIAPKSLQRPMSRLKASARVLRNPPFRTSLPPITARIVGEPLEIRGLEQRVIAIKKTEKIDQRPKSSFKTQNLSNNAHSISMN